MFGPWVRFEARQLSVCFKISDQINIILLFIFILYTRQKHSSNLGVFVHIKNKSTQKTGINMAYIVFRCLEESLCNDLVNKNRKPNEHRQKYIYLKGL